jgi:hypothetical protein
MKYFKTPLRTDDTNFFSQNHENNNYTPVYIDKMNNFDRADFNFSFNFSQKCQI